MFFAEYLNETQSSISTGNLNPRKRRLKSLLPKNVRAFPQDFFEVNQTSLAPTTILSRASPESDEGTHRPTFPLELHPIPLPRSSFFFQQSALTRELKNISSQPTFRIRDRIVLAPLLNESKSSDRSHVVNRGVEDDGLTLRRLYSGSMDQLGVMDKENQRPRNLQLLDLKSHGPAHSRFFTEPTNYSCANQSKSTEKSFSIPGYSIIEQDTDAIGSPRSNNSTL